MKLDKDKVEHIAELVRIEISEKDKAKFAEELSEILDYVDELETAETQNIKPIEQISCLENITREDKITPSLPVEKALENAPVKEDGFIKVKKILE